MKKWLIPLLAVLLIIGLFEVYTFLSTGFFREINNSKNYDVIAKVPLKGAEDLTIAYEDQFMIISQDDRAASLHGRKRSGGLYFLDLTKPPYEPSLLKTSVPLYPHGISLFKLDSGLYQLLVINHYQKHSIEKFNLIGDSLIHLYTFEDIAMISPNDVVHLDKERFYFTNDHGYTSKWGLLAENYLGLAASNVTFYDGKEYLSVATDIAYANGINISKDRKELLIASPRGFKLLYYDILADGLLTKSRSIDVGSGIDNIELDPDGNLWLGSHPNLLAFSAYAAGKKTMAPSEVIYVSKEGEVLSVYENDGSIMSATSVVASYKNLLFVGTVMDDYLFVLEAN